MHTRKAGKNGRQERACKARIDKGQLETKIGITN